MKRIVYYAIVIIAFAVTPAWAAEDCYKAQEISKKASKHILTNPARTQRYLLDALKRCPNSASLNYNLAMTYYQSGQMTMAIKQLHETIKVNSEYADAYNALAFIYYKSGQHGMAAQNIKTALALDPYNIVFKDTQNLIFAANMAKEIDIDNPPATSIRNTYDIAVVIGNRDYRDKDNIPSVDYAVNDARTIKKYLRETLGFKEENIIYRENATKTDFDMIFGNHDNHKGKIYKFVMSGQSNIFVYYSGHGAPGTNDQKGYFVPSDASAMDIELTGYPLDLMYRNLQKVSEEKNLPGTLIVLDSCFSGSSERGMLIKAASPLLIEIESPILESLNTAVIASSSGKQISSWYPEKRHGLFTYYLLKSLRQEVQNGGNITTGRLFERLSDEAEGLSYFALRKFNREQTPQLMGNPELSILNLGGTNNDQ